jgi:dipeptidyl-peptidase-4
MRFVFFLLMSLANLSAFAAPLTIERIHADPALSGPGVRNLQIAPDGERVCFLKGREDDQFQLDLWEYNLRDKEMRRLVDTKALQPDEAMSAAEKARRERERSAAFRGISDYSWAPDSKEVLLTLSGKLYLVTLAHPEHARLIASGDVIDPKVSPKGRYVSFVRDQNLFAGAATHHGWWRHHP